MFFHTINYLAVLVAAIVGMGIGFIWYSPVLFSKAWMESKGWTTESMGVAYKGKPMAWVWIASTVATLVTAFIVAALFSSLVVTSLSGMLLLGICVWLGFTVPIKLGDFLFGGERFNGFLISAGHELIVTLAMCLIIGLWR